MAFPNPHCLQFLPLSPASLYAKWSVFDLDFTPGFDPASTLVEGRLHVVTDEHLMVRRVVLGGADHTEAG